MKLIIAAMLLAPITAMAKNPSEPGRQTLGEALTAPSSGSVGTSTPCQFITGCAASGTVTVTPGWQPFDVALSPDAVAMAGRVGAQIAKEIALSKDEATRAALKRVLDAVAK